MKHARIPVLRIRVEPQTIRILEGHLGSSAVLLEVGGNVLRIRPVLCSHQDHLIFPQCRKCDKFPQGCRKVNKVSYGYGEEVILYAEDIVSKIGFNTWSRPRTFTARWDGEFSYVVFLGGR